MKNILFFIIMLFFSYNLESQTISTNENTRKYKNEKELTGIKPPKINKMGGKFFIQGIRWALDSTITFLDQNQYIFSISNGENNKKPVANDIKLY